MLLTKDNILNGPTCRAFTIIELLIALVLFVTVITMGLLLFSNVQRSLVRFQSHSERYYDYISLINKLEQDLNAATQIKHTTNGAIFFLYDADVSYSFSIDGVKRCDGNRTISFDISNAAFDVLYNDTDDDVVGITIVFAEEEHPLRFSVFRSLRSSSFLLNN